MQEEDTARGGRARLSALKADQAATSGRPAEDHAGYPRSEDHAVVPANQLLEVAGALTDGATRLHAQLRHLHPEDRDAVLDIVAGQLSDIVTLWTGLVRGIVTAPSGSEDPLDLPERAERPARPDRRERSARLEEAEAEGDEQARRARRQGPAGAPTRAPAPAARLTEDEDELDDEPEHVNPYRRPAAAVDSGEPPPPVGPLTRDELTGVLNRQAGFTALNREMDRCRHGGERFVLGYLNVDGLKAVNDSRGPRAGDELLRKVTAALRATLRSYDVICRLGGDEFLFSLPGADMATAEMRFKEFAVILAEDAPGGSASVGFAQLRENDTIDDLIARADTDLLKSRRGRRRSAR